MTEREILQQIDKIEKKVADEIRAFFPLDLGNYTIEVKEIEFIRPKLFDLDNELMLKNNGATLTGKVSATFELVNKSTGKVTKKQRKTIAMIPYLTNRGTYIINGNEKIITKQTSAKPGVYTYDKGNNVESYMFTQEGKNITLVFEPEDNNFTIQIEKKTFNAITFLEVLGITQAEIINAIGNTKISDPIIRKAQSKNFNNEVMKIWQLMPIKVKTEKNPGRTPPIDVAIDDIRRYMFGIVDFGNTGKDVMKLTLGYSSSKLDKQVFLNAIKKVMQIAQADTQDKKDAIADDIDDIRFQNILADEDQISYYIRVGLNEIENTLRAAVRESDKGTVLTKISPNKVSGELNRFMATGSLVDQVEQTNPILMSAARRKLTSLGERGLSPEAATSETRNLQNTAFGKIDPVETPESGKIGLVTHLTSDVDVKNLTIESKYYEVKGGKFTKDPKQVARLTPLNEYDKYIAFHDVNTFKEVGNVVTLPARVLVRYRGNILEVPSAKVEYVDISPHVIWGDATRLIPFSAHNDGNRMLMGSNMQKQALILANREAPLVQSAIGTDHEDTYEKKIAEDNAFIVKSDISGIVARVDKDSIVIKDNKGQDHVHKLMNYFPLNMSNYINNTPVVKAGDKVSKGQLLADGWQTKGGVMAHGINARIAYMPWKGYNYEDGYVVSESFAKKMGTEELKEIVVEIPENAIGGKGSNIKSILSQLNVPSDKLSKLDERGVIKVGEKVSAGTILVGIAVEDTTKDDRPEYRLMRALGTELAKTYKNKSSVIEGYISGEVVRVNDVAAGSDVKEAVKITILQRNPLQDGDKIAGRHGNKGVITLIEKDEDMPKAEDGEPIDIIYSPLGVPSRKNLGQLYETNAGLIASKTGKPFKVYNFDHKEAERVLKGLEEIGYPEGKMTLVDPETGKPFDNKVTVGVSYIMKLKHKVDDKLQARTYGPTNFLYNTPMKQTGTLAGEKQNPQKLGEMEIRALQASKAVNMIDEAIKLKSDAAGDFAHRKAIFNALAFGGIDQVMGKIPESLKIFRDYATALGINVRPLRDGKAMQTLDEKFNSLAIAPLKADEVKRLSRGEVTNSTIFTARVTGDKPEEKGLFDPKIFGETPEEQRVYWGHISLGMPVPNPFLLSSFANPYSSLLGINGARIKEIMANQVGVVTKPGKTGRKQFDIIDLEEAEKIAGEDKDFAYEVSGRALETMLKSINVSKAIEDTQTAIVSTKPKDRDALYKKLRILNMLKENNMKPDDLMIHNLPVIPAGLRPFEKTGGGRQVTNDANELYKRVVQLNEKAKKLNDPKTWYITDSKVKYDTLRDLYKNIENVMGVNTTPVEVTGRELKGFTKKMTGKDGLIRGRLMSKYLDYSGRSVITVNPSLNLDEAGLPVDIAAKLYQPFVMRELLTSQRAKTQVEAAEKSKNIGDPDTWEALQKVVAARPVILNRAPSLHQFSLQAFTPKLTKSRAVELNPLIVTGFNADFDGDQMAVHVPLTTDSVNEAKKLMLPSSNMINPTNGNLLAVIKGEATLGLYYLTVDKYKGKVFTKDMAKKSFMNYEQLFQAYKKGDVGPFEIVMLDNVAAPVGQHLVNTVLPSKYRDYRRILNGKNTQALIEKIIAEEDEGGNQTAVVALGKLKDIGFLAATKSGMSIGIKDMVADPTKGDLLAKADELVAKNPEKALNIYYDVQEAIKKRVSDVLPTDNPTYMLMDSGAKGSSDQVARMSSFVGLSKDITGRMIPVPVRGSFKDGLSPGEMWIHAFDSRRGLADRSLSTAEPGALTRDIWSSVQDAIITIADCGDTEGIYLDVSDKSIVGRVVCKPIKDADDNILFRRGTLLDTNAKDTIKRHKGILGVYVRSPLTCKATKGYCQKCYGAIPGTNKLADVGEPVGVIASQAIGEPTAQGIMKTFHGGGVNLTKREVSSVIPRVIELFNVSDNPKNKSILSPVDGRVLSVTKDVTTKIVTIESVVNGKKSMRNIKVPLVKDVLVHVGDYISKGDRITESDGALAPREVLEYKGLRPAQEYMIDELSGLIGDKTNKKHFELAVSKLSEKVKIDQNSTSPWIPGHIVRRNEVEAWNVNHAGRKETVPAHEIIKIVGNTAGKTYRDRSGATIIREGDEITLPVLDKIRGLGVKNVEVYAKRVEYTPEIYGVTSNPLKGSENWFSQLGFQNIKQPFAEGAVFGKVDVLDEPRSRVMAGKKLNIGENFNKWKQEFERIRQSLGNHIANLF